MKQFNGKKMLPPDDIENLWGGKHHIVHMAHDPT